MKIPIKNTNTLKKNALKYLRDYNSSLIDYRQYKMARLIDGYKLVLDLGFANQPNLFLKNAKIIGIDIQKVEKPANYYKVICADVTTLSSFIEEKSVDGIISGELLEHLENPIGFLRECRKVLKKKGILVLSTPNPHFFGEAILTMFMIRKLFYSKQHVCIYPQRWLVRMLELAGFSEVQIYAGGLKIPYLGTVPFFRTFGNYSIAVANK